MLAPSAFLASAAATLPRQEAIVSAYRRSRRHRSIRNQNHVELCGQHDATLIPVQAHPTSLGRSGHNRRL